MWGTEDRVRLKETRRITTISKFLPWTRFLIFAPAQTGKIW